MNHVINYFKVLAIPLGVLIIAPLILSIMNLLNIKTYQAIILIIMLVTALVSGFMIGRKTQKKGYINGIIFGTVLSLCLFLLSLFGKNTYAINSLIYYLIIIISTTFGSMLGIQKKPTQE